MGLFNKKERIPSIPRSEPLPELPPIHPTNEKTEKKDLPELPTFPVSSKNENFNQEMVKSAVSDNSPLNEIGPEERGIPPTLPQHPQHIMSHPTPEPILHSTPEPIAKVIPEPAPIQNPEPEKPVMESSIPEPPRSLTPMNIEESRESTILRPAVQLPRTKKPEGPIFVRIDKFQEAQKNFDEIKSRATEIENILKKIKEVKVKEEDELKGWIEDVEKLKSRISSIDENVFNQL